MLFGIIEAGRAIFQYNVLSSAAREGARFAIVRGADSGRTVSEADVRTWVQARAVGITPTVTVTWTPNKSPGSTVRVQVQHTFNSLVPLIPIRNRQMTASSRMTILR